MDLIYLATPYYHSSWEVCNERFEIVSQIAAMLFKSGKKVFSPISHSHPIAKFGLGKGIEDWYEYDLFFLSLCKELYIVMVPGWQASKGVGIEYEYAMKHGIKVSFVEYKEKQKIRNINIVPFCDKNWYEDIDKFVKCYR